MPGNNNLFSRLTENVKNTKNEFIALPDGRVYRYCDMFELTSRYANALKTIGIRKNDRVLAQTEKQIECIWLYLACLRIGAIYITINPAYTLTETKYFISDSKPKLFVITEFNKHAELLELCKTLGEIIVKDLKNTGNNSICALASLESTEFETCVNNNEDIAAILYTSGTTGRSKGALISHQNLFSNAKTLSDIWQMSSSDKLLHILPIYHTHGLFVAFNSTLYAGGSILFHKKFLVDEVIRDISKVTILMGVPTHYIRLISERKFSKQLTSKMRLFISGSAPLSSEVYSNFKKITGLEILERYGMTETNMITSNPYNGERKSGTVGVPLPDVIVRIRDIETGKLNENGSVGSIEVKGPNVFSGYWKMEERAKIDFQKDGFFITGDLGFFDSDGYLNISGRDKDLIISGGLNVYPAEVEQVLDALPEVSESALIGLPHPDFGEGVTAVITLSDKQSTLNEQELRGRISEQLASFKVPLTIKVKERLPKNAMGKIQKNLLRTEFESIYSKKS